MKKIFLAAMMALTFAGCHAQDGGIKKDISSAQDTTAQNKPQVSWKVNKRYDDNGNLTGYDSTYSWSYSSNGAANSDAGADSMLNVFRQQFNGFPSFFPQGFGAAFGNDSLFFHDFNSPGELMQKWGDNFFDMGKMMRRLDSLGSSLLDDNFPDMETKPKSSIRNGYRL
jgi:hypothetical protein